MVLDELKKFIVKGTFIDTISSEKLRIRKGYILVENGIIKSFSEQTQMKHYEYLITQIN